MAPTNLPFTVPVIADNARPMLVVGWRQGQSLSVGEIVAGKEVSEHLRAAARQTITAIGQHESAAEYSPEMPFEHGDDVLFTSNSQVFEESSLGTGLFPTSPLARIAADSLPARPLVFYSVTLSLDGKRYAFIRKTNPVTGARPGGILAGLGDVLQRLGGPVLALEGDFQMVVDQDGRIISTEIRAFELLFRDEKQLAKKVPEWVAGLGSAYGPGLAPGSAAKLEARAKTDRRLRRRLYAIAHRGHLPQVTPQRLRTHVQSLGLPVGSVLDDQNRLVFDDADPFTLAYLLNEDLFVGGLTDAGFRSETKASRT